MTLEKPQNDPIDNRRKKLVFRSWHRGTREMDLLLGRFADKHVFDMSEDQLSQFERLLDCNDPELYEWYSGRTLPPSNDDSSVLKLFLTYKFHETN